MRRARQSRQRAGGAAEPQRRTRVAPPCGATWADGWQPSVLLLVWHSGAGCGNADLLSPRGDAAASAPAATQSGATPSARASGCAWSTCGTRRCCAACSRSTRVSMLFRQERTGGQAFQSGMHVQGRCCCRCRRARRHNFADVAAWRRQAAPGALLPRACYIKGNPGPAPTLPPPPCSLCLCAQPMVTRHQQLAPRPQVRAARRVPGRL